MDLQFLLKLNVAEAVNDFLWRFDSCLFIFHLPLDIVAGIFELEGERRVAQEEIKGAAVDLKLVFIYL